MDAYGRPLYGGNPFGPPGSKQDLNPSTGLVTSDGKTVAKSEWGGLPTSDFLNAVDGSDVDESSSEGEFTDEEGDEEQSDGEHANDGIESVLPPPATVVATAPGDLRKQHAGDETPLVDSSQKRLYQVLEQVNVTEKQSNAVFSSEIQYVVPSAPDVAEGAESVLSKAMLPSETAKRKRKHEDDEEDLGKNFKF